VAFVLLLGMALSNAGSSSDEASEAPLPFPEYDVAAPAPVEPGLPDMTASRADGNGEPFGMALGTTVVAQDLASRLQVEVLPSPSRREQGRLVVPVSLTARESLDGQTGLARPPRLVLRTVDGRELVPEVLGDPYPQVLPVGATWTGELSFAGDPSGGVLAAVGDRTVAAWVLPAG
jgi:hypothetical protein